MHKPDEEARTCPDCGDFYEEFWEHIRRRPTFNVCVPAEEWTVPNPWSELPKGNCDCPGCRRERERRQNWTMNGGYATHGGVETYNQRHGVEFAEVRPRVLKRDDYTCQGPGCGITDEEHRGRDDLFPPGGGLHINHIIDTTEFEDRETPHQMKNLITLCDSCHKQETRGVLVCEQGNPPTVKASNV